jgi:hypothetical protein
MPLTASTVLRPSSPFLALLLRVALPEKRLSRSKYCAYEQKALLSASGGGKIVGKTKSVFQEKEGHENPPS